MCVAQLFLTCALTLTTILLSMLCRSQTTSCIPTLQLCLEFLLRCFVVVAFAVRAHAANLGPLFCALLAGTWSQDGKPRSRSQNPLLAQKGWSQAFKQSTAAHLYAERACYSSILQAMSSKACFSLKSSSESSSLTDITMGKHYK